MKRESAFGFDARLKDDATIAVPPEVVKALGRDAATILHVQLTPASVWDELRERGITEDEVQAIAQLQMETREQVIGFLLAEGALAGPATGDPKEKGTRP